ncbi:hypothetical protein P5673_014328 [Acropora cervicornis]|uniref:Uncharacterized protein n=1 Tax=Acropora cervicornis TaxID=6130 RepID=A0AAD9V698_ACRCE|nr:hypothetical protein P5673_014328 [Acropora cervicornis]
MEQKLRIFIRKDFKLCDSGFNQWFNQREILTLPLEKPGQISHIQNKLSQNCYISRFISQDGKESKGKSFSHLGSKADFWCLESVDVDGPCVVSHGWTSSSKLLTLLYLFSSVKKELNLL